MPDVLTEVSGRPLRESGIVGVVYFIAVRRVDFVPVVEVVIDFRIDRATVVVGIASGPEQVVGAAIAAQPLKSSGIQAVRNKPSRSISGIVKMIRAGHGVQRTRDPTGLIELLSKQVPTCGAGWNKRGTVDLGMRAIRFRRIGSQSAEYTQVSKRAAIRRPWTAIDVHGGGLSKDADRLLRLPRVAVDEIVEVANDSASRAIGQHRRIDDRPRLHELLIPKR